MNTENLLGYLPKDKFDIKSVIHLYELNDEDLIVISDRLLEWMQDYNWPVASVMATFLIAKQDLIIDSVKAVLDLNNKDAEWKYWVIQKLVFYFSLKNLSMLYDLLDQIDKNPTKLEKELDVDGWARAVLEGYRRRKERSTLNHPYDTDMANSLYLLSDTDVHIVAGRLLMELDELYEDVVVSVTVFIIAKQDLLIGDIKNILISDRVGDKKKKFIYNKLINYLTESNQQIIGMYYKPEIDE